MREITPPGPIHSMPGKATAKQLAVRLRAHMIEGLPTVVIARELAEQIAEALEFHDARVTELLKAASTEVIKRREINAHRLKLMDYVRNAGNKFRFYARNHRAKGTLEADEKAQVNDMMADQADRAILWESPPGEMGRP